MKNQFESGINVSEALFHEVVEPIINSEYPKLKYSSALIGSGSEVLGFDTAISTDHDWRPRVYIFLSSRDHNRVGQKLEEFLRISLPKKFRDYDLSLDDPDDLRSKHVYSTNSFIKKYLSFDNKKKPSHLDWLTFDEHRLLGIVSGKVFRDEGKELEKMREKFNYYPQDVWLYLMASEWLKIAEEEAFVGRAGHVDDEIGSRIIASRIIQSLIRLCFLTEKVYPPYSKWFGSAFKNLRCSKAMLPHINDALNARTWKKREAALSNLYSKIVTLHNKLGVTSKVKSKVRKYHGRPYLVIGSHQIAEMLKKEIKSRSMKLLPLIGSVNQFTDTVLLIEGDETRLACKKLYF